MSTPHLGAEKGEIAESILLPGDPLRAKFIAETFLKDVICYTEVRGMLGFTGTYKGKRVSVQGTGMGVPSISIYVYELMNFYGVKNLIRVGTCGSMQEDVKLRDVVIAMSASTDSAVNKLRFNGMDFAPTADFNLLRRAWEKAGSLGISAKVGNVLTAEMETAALYTLAARFKVNALSLLTVSDSIVTGESTTSEERQTTFNQMIEVALEVV